MSILRYFYVFLCLLLLPLSAVTQSPYLLQNGQELGIAGASIGVLAYSRLQYKRLTPLKPKELKLLKREDIFAIDRKATYNQSLFAKKTSDILLRSSVAIPFTMLLGQESRSDFGKSGVFALQTLLINAALTDLTKVTFKRKRPFVYNEFTDINRKLAKTARTSFYSGHTSTVASMYFLSAKLYSDYYPDSKWKPVVWSAAVLVPATTGLLRVKAGKHYFTDVLVGFVTGAAIGFLVPEIHKISQ
jgi:membrane-associated phospholipid phosphatase